MRVRSWRLPAAAAALAIAPAFAQTVAPPVGIYVLDDPSDGKPVTSVYASGLTSSPAYANVIAGHAIFVPIEKILPSVTTWGQFNWDWSYLDTLVQTALTHNKHFSIELETAFQSNTDYLQSLPAGFATACGANCAPVFDVWTTGGTADRCISAYIPLPWVPNVQQFWDATARALAAHLKQTGAYDSLTLVHLPGLSVYDEEIRLPTGSPHPASTDTTVCPDGRSANPAVANDASASHWQSLGYTDAAVIAGFRAIATSFAQAFPDRYLGMSLFGGGAAGFDFPNLSNDPPAYVTGQLVQTVAAVAPGRLLLQSDFLDSNSSDSEVGRLSVQYATAVGWQSNKHGGTGAGCAGGGPNSCTPDGAAGPYYDLLLNGARTAGRYVEVWSADVVAYPQALAAAKAAQLYQPNYQGLWWASPPSSESGWGVNLTHQGTTLFATWFTYASDGSGLWLVVTAQSTADNSFTGTLYRTTGPAFNAVPWSPSSVVATPVGTATFTFADQSNGTFEYTVNGISQSKPITREIFSSPVPTCAAGSTASPTNYQDLWWHAPANSEGGWGVNLTHQGDTIFATWFTYDTSGKGLWLVVTAPKVSAGSYSGTLFRTTGPAFNATPWNPSQVVATAAGTATFTFSDAANGTFAYTVNGISQSKAITREVFSSPLTVCQ